MTQTALILGASGRFGRNVAEAFWNAGWRVHIFDRRTGDLSQAACGVDVIVNGWNPPYTKWASQLPGLTDQVIAAAKSSGATVILPGNVYVYGPDAPEAFGPGVSHAAQNTLGRLRAEMEERYRTAGIRCIVLRAGDFLDTEASGNWFDRVMAAPLKNGRLKYPGDPDVPHAWAYLPDVARATVALAERRADLPDHAEIAFPGYTLTGKQLAGMTELAVGWKLRIQRMSWLSIRLAQPFWPMARHLLETRYLWFKPHRMDPKSFDKVLPGFVETDPVKALGRAIAPILREESDRPKPTDEDQHPLPTARHQRA